jgi:glycosyltransferase involved in cell wall biosynthesis
MEKKKNARVTNPRERRKKVSTRKKGDGSRKLEVGSWKTEDGSGKLEDGSRKSQSQFQSQSHREDGSKKKLPMVHVIVRTHGRPGYFRQCVESIAVQIYDNKVVHVVSDDAESEAYAREALDAGLVDEVTRVDPASFENQLGDFNFLQRHGYCKSRTDYRKHFYDLYLNAEMERIYNGYIFIVDDDKVLPDPLLLERIAKNLAEDVLVVGQYSMEKRTLPVGERWEKLPFDRAHIDMSCVLFHVKHREVAKLDGHGAGDWRMCNRLAKALKVVWMDEVFVVADNNGNSGKKEIQLKH